MLRALPVEILRGLFDLVYPPVCLICEHPLEGSGHQALCRACWRAMPRGREPRCTRCGAIDSLRWGDHGCFHCRRRSFPHRTIFSIGPHDGRLRDLIHRLKAGRGFPAAARPMVRMLEDRICRHEWPAGRSPELIVPVPASRRRWRRSGFNPAGALAHRLARRLGLGYTERGLDRRREAPPQTGLSGVARRRNLRSVYHGCRRRVAGRRIVLVDDVSTTGTTVLEAARALRTAGARSVDVVVAAVRSNDRVTSSTER